MTKKKTSKRPTAKPTTIYRKLLLARKEFHAKKLVKSGLNTFSDYRYFQLDDFLGWAMECLDKQGLVPVVTFDNDFATMTVFDADSSDTIVITSPMSTAQLKACHPVQNLGAVQTYERRYLWLCLMEVVEGDPVEAAPIVEPATPEQIAALYDYLETDLMNDGQRTWVREGADKITADQASYVLDKLKELERKREAEGE